MSELETNRKANKTMSNPYPEGSPEHLLVEIFGKPVCPAGRGELNYFTTRDFEYEDWRHADDNTPCNCEDRA